MAEDQDNELVTRWLNKELSDQEFAALASEEELIKYRQILSEVDTWTPSLDSEVFDPYSVTSRDKAPEKRGKVIAFPRISWQLAASLIVGLSSAIYFFLSSETSYTADIGTTREVILPDEASKVILSSGSSVSWSRNDWTDAKREVTIKGKAYLIIAKGEKFRARTKTGVVEVLGTKFEVISTGDQFEFACFEGKVKGVVEGKEIIADPSDAFRFVAGVWEKYEVTGSDPSWLNDSSTFSNAPLSQVLKTLESEYGLTVDAGGVDLDRRFTGVFPNKNLDLALKIIFDPLEISYKIDGKKLTLTQ